MLDCDAVDAASNGEDDSKLYLSRLRQQAHVFGRYQLLVKLLKSDHDAHLKTAKFLSPSRIPRGELPNVQDVLYVPFTAAGNNEKEACRGEPDFMIDADERSECLLGRVDNIVGLSVR